MNLIIECLLIGLYTSLFSILLFFKININIQLFIIGFLKHYLGYYIGIHDYYCSNKGKTKALKTKIVQDSIYEGICFILLGKTIIIIFKQNYIMSLFITGFIFNLISEYIYLHKYFYDNRCIL